LVTLKKQKVPIKRAYLFGSWAKGTQHRWSDIDLAVISPAFTGLWKTNRTLSKALLSDFVGIEAHGFHPDNFDPRISPVADEIVKHGIRII
jgi:hypothetical protein